MILKLILGYFREKKNTILRASQISVLKLMWEKVVLVQVEVGFPISIFQHTIHLARRPLDPAAFSTHVCGYVCTIS